MRVILVLCWVLMAEVHTSPDDTLANKVFDPILASKRASNLLIVILVILAALALFLIWFLATRPISPEALLQMSRSALDALPDVPFTR